MATIIEAKTGEITKDSFLMTQKTKSHCRIDSENGTIYSFEANILNHKAVFEYLSKYKVGDFFNIIFNDKK